MERITEQLEEIASEMCDNFCKYPEMYSSDDWEKMLEEDTTPCSNCPLNRL